MSAPIPSLRSISEDEADVGETEDATDVTDGDEGCSTGGTIEDVVGVFLFSIPLPIIAYIRLPFCPLRPIGRPTKSSSTLESSPGQVLQQRPDSKIAFSQSGLGQSCLMFLHLTRVDG